MAHLRPAKVRTYGYSSVRNLESSIISYRNPIVCSVESTRLTSARRWESRDNQRVLARPAASSVVCGERDAGFLSTPSTPNADRLGNERWLRSTGPTAGPVPALEWRPPRLAGVRNSTPVASNHRTFELFYPAEIQQCRSSYVRLTSAARSRVSGGGREKRIASVQRVLKRQRTQAPTLHLTIPR